jgi:membrane dipeptidase
MIPIIDAHLDLAWNAASWNRDLTLPLDELNALEATTTDHRARGRAVVSFPEMRRGGVGLCLATVLARAKPHVRPDRGFLRREIDFATQDIAYASARGQAAYYRAMEARGAMTRITTGAELDAHWSRWLVAPSTCPIGYVLAMEGADPIVTPAQAEEWWEQGLRAVGLSHYGKSAYGVGTGDDGPLTPAGVELLRALERLGMILDLTHSADQSFYQALDTFGGRVIASHNNCRTLVPGDRQYSDEQIGLLIQRGAVIGAALDGWMLQPGWVVGQTTSERITLANVADHIDHVCQLAGNAEHIGIGSDLDGGFGNEQSPSDVKSIADLQKLEAVLRSRGYSTADVERIFHGNWLRFLREALPR